MKRLIFVVALIVAALFDHAALADTDAPIECFSSPEALHEAHPESHAVYTTHAAWWTESSKCWFAGKPIAKPTMKPRADAAVSPTPSKPIAQARPLQPTQEVKATYEEVAAALRAMMFDPEASPTDFEGRFSAVVKASTFLLWRRCFATPTWNLCQSST